MQQAWLFFVYFLLEDKQMTKRGDGGKTRLPVWSAGPVSVLMWVYFLLALQRFEGADGELWLGH